MSNKKLVIKRLNPDSLADILELVAQGLEHNGYSEDCTPNLLRKIAAGIISCEIENGNLPETKANKARREFDGPLDEGYLKLCIFGKPADFI